MDDGPADPFRAVNFRFKFDGDELAGFQDVSGLGTVLTVAEYRQGNENANLVR